MERHEPMSRSVPPTFIAGHVPKNSFNPKSKIQNPKLVDFIDMKRMHLDGEKFISDFFFSVNNLTVISGKIMKEV
ncbi:MULTISPECIES: hypothetical protein [unclassified Nostoc]|uniref:hypothetical protein n=1 Tax=unclassified Nostoc TaxID=2593658 RepID=UPI002AD557EF|nr:hypothetical protein [Nostoc sp. ChiQUE02]MDZ8232977.1 hypothetical protein [Nostoc sp. ChiQUE02]